MHLNFVGRTTYTSTFVIDFFNWKNSRKKVKIQNLIPLVVQKLKKLFSIAFGDMMFIQNYGVCFTKYF
jgi:hypothetical protein